MWTTDKPTEPGWYWWRLQYVVDGEWSERVIEIVSVPNGDLYSPRLGVINEHTIGQWLGPITPQEDTP